MCARMRVHVCVVRARAHVRIPTHADVCVHAKSLMNACIRVCVPARMRTQAKTQQRKARTLAAATPEVCGDEAIISQ